MAFVFLVVLLFFSQMISAQSVSSIDVASVEIIGDDGFVRRNEFGTNDAVVWRSNPDLLVTKILYRQSSDAGFGVSYAPIQKMLAFPNSSYNVQAILTSNWLRNISSITFYVARTKVYDDANRIHIDTLQSAVEIDPSVGAWGERYCVTGISKYVGSASAAETMVNAGYSLSQYDEVTYNFEVPYSGYIRLRVNSICTSTYNTKCPYLLIPELRVEYDAPMADPCSHCFQITIR